MTKPDPNLIAHNCGKRLRTFADSKEWSSRKMHRLRALFGELAVDGVASANRLRELVELTGVRPSDREALQQPSSQHVPLVWRGYYGGPMSEQIERSIPS